MIVPSVLLNSERSWNKCDKCLLCSTNSFNVIFVYNPEFLISSSESNSKTLLICEFLPSFNFGRFNDDGLEENEGEKLLESRFEFNKNVVVHNHVDIIDDKKYNAEIENP